MKKLKLASVVILGVALTGCSGFFLGKDNTPTPTPIDKNASSSLVQKVWASKINAAAGKTGLRFTIGHDQSTVYVAGAGGTVSALDSSTGKVRWSKKVGALYTGVGANNSHVYVGTKAGELIALSSGNGEKVWSTKLLGAPVSTPAANDSLVIVRTLGGAVHSFNATTGEDSWAYMLATPDLNLRGGAAPVIMDQTVLIPTDMGQLGLLNFDNGKVLWGKNLGQVRGGNISARVVDIDAEPVVDNGVVYVGVARSGIAAVSLKTAQTLWSLKQGVYAGLTVDQDTLYATHDNGVISALAKNNGSLRWDSSSLTGRKLTRPVVLNNKIVVGDFEGFVHVLDANSGALLGSTRITKSAFLPDILLMNGGIILQDVSGGVFRVSI